MSEDPTKNIGEKYQTSPTLETIVQMLAELREQMNARFDGLETRIERLEARMDGFELRLERVEEQLDRMTSVVHETRADLREVEKRLKEAA
ncbi:MAG TPA: hypothetical protein VFA21_00175 [Pyrinomonadaceae bacterium]|jgi:chromosome segregation ATPase|nr:hypothetical protein [Pyrinomonadaceae bacterium]